MADQKIGVKYIGRRPTFRDRLFGTGLEFAQGQTRQIPADVARKFFHHPSEFERDDGQPEAVTPTGDGTDEALAQAKARQEKDTKALDELQHLRDQVNRMEKPDLQAIAKNKYGQPLDGRIGVQAMREQVVSLIDRFGAV
jgi:hypothetical protein